MGCVGECPNHCGANSYCTGHCVPCPANLTSWAETIVQLVTEVKASHLSELESSINAERTHVLRRGLTPACPANCSNTYVFSGSRSADDIFLALHIGNVKTANNGTSYCTTIPSPPNFVQYVDNPTRIDIDALRSGINGTQGNCICNAHCTCNIDCSCNGQCPTNGLPY